MFTTLFVQPIYNAIILLFFVFKDAGLVIIVFSVLIRLAFWPLTAKTIHSQKKLQELQPDIADAKKKAGGDKQKESTMLMELYREKGINPFSSCLPTLYQLPFLFAVFTIFRDLKIDANLIYAPLKNLPFINSFLAGAQFHPTLFGVLDLSRVPLKDGTYIPGIVLAVVMGLTQFIQGKMLSPKKPDQTQAMMSQMNYVFPALFVWLSLTSFPVALTLYWTTYNVMNIIQQQLILKTDIGILKALWKKRSKNIPKGS